MWEANKNWSGIKLHPSRFNKTKLWLFDFLSSSSNKEATVLAVTFWHIWEARNTARNTPEAPHPHQTVNKIIAYSELIMQHLYSPVLVHRRESSSSSSSWPPPPAGLIVINSDAAIFSVTNMSDAGVVTLDHDGKCIAACSEPIQGALEPELAEALALRRVVYLARDERFSKVIFASDCQSLVQRINYSGHDRSCIGSVVKEIKLASRGFVSAVFKHVRWHLNAAAHLLAKSCRNSSSLIVFHSGPDCIRKTLCNIAL